ncbi:hypothetical protein OAU50_04865 [Planctomycetota bacterium]|nr:hypothetical protein [Planctomycetota bacterium]
MSSKFYLMSALVVCAFIGACAESSDDGGGGGGSTGGGNNAPTVVVKAGTMTMMHSMTHVVDYNDTVAGESFVITVNDADGDLTSCVTTISNAGSTGILTSQWSNASSAVSYNLNPSTGTFNAVSGATHVVTVTVNDGTTQTVLQFNIDQRPQMALAAPQLGTGNHTPGSVTFTSIAAPGISLNVPTDIDFSPITTNELWIVNRGDPSIVIFDDVTASIVTGEKVDSTNGPGAWGHFLENVSGISWGANTSSSGTGWTMATSQDGNNGNNFMGPTLWSADRSVLRVSTGSMNTSHLDMLHSTTYGKGIVHESANKYWTFGICYDTLATTPESALTMYDFGADHGPGHSQHADGKKYHYVIGQVDIKAGVNSGMAFDQTSKLLYVCDTGNGRVVALDTTSGTQAAGTLASWSGDGVDYEVTGATLTTVIAAAGHLTDPSGLELYNNTLYISDNATGIIHAYDLSGNRLNWIDTGMGVGALSGLDMGPDGKIYFCNTKTNTIYRIDP